MSEELPPTRHGQRHRRFQFAAWTLILMVLVTLVLAEILVRILLRYNTPDTVRENSLQLRESVYTRSLLLPHQRPEPSKAWGSRAGDTPPTASFTINEHGFRGASFRLEKPAGTCRVIVLGGSAVFDKDAQLGRDWPHLVEQILRSDGNPDVQVINAGVPGYASSDSLGRLFAGVWALEPDVLLLYNAWNDIKYFGSITLDEPLGEAIRPFRVGHDPFRFYQGSLDRLFSVSQLYVKLRTRYYFRKIRVGREGALPEGTTVSRINPLGLAQYRLNIKLFVEASKEIGAVPVLVTQATLVTSDLPHEERKRINYGYARLEHSSLAGAFSSCHQVVRDLAREDGAELIDAAAHLSGQPELFNDHVHTSALGSQRLAALVADRLAQITAAACEDE